VRLSHHRLLSLLATPALLAFAVTGAQARSHVQTGAAPVKVAPATILVTSKGATLYVFALDKPNKSACYGTCAKYWPPFLIAKGVTPAASMSGVSGAFGVSTRTDGARQLTFDGAPLYTFLGDKKAGEMNGQGSTASGGYWWAAVAGAK